MHFPNTAFRTSRYWFVLQEIIFLVKKRYLLVLFIFWTSLAFEQYGNLKGKVVTTDQKPAPFVSVVVEESKMGVTSSEDGSFSIQHIKQGAYTIVASYIGLQTIRQQVQVTENQTAEVNLVLQENSKKLDEVIVETKR